MRFFLETMKNLTKCFSSSAWIFFVMLMLILSAGEIMLNVTIIDSDKYRIITFFFFKFKLI